MSAMLLSSCSTDPTTRYETFIHGSWEAGHVNLVTNQPDDDTPMYIFTFSPNGTGVKVYTDKGNIAEEFRYTITGYPKKAGLDYDFTIHYTSLKPDGSVLYNDILRGKKTGPRSWELYAEGGYTLLHVMHKL